MSVDVTHVEPAVFADDHGRPTIGSLLAAEFLRLRSRRMVKVMTVVALGIVLFFAFVSYMESRPVSAAEQASAKAMAASERASCEEGFATSGSDPSVTLEDACGGISAENYLSSSPFTIESTFVDGVVGMGVAAAALLLLVGASAGGAEWAARTMPALLYWEPRRLRVMGAKVFVLATYAVALCAVMMALWAVLGLAVYSVHGPDNGPALPDDFSSELIAIVLRGMFSCALAVLAGFGLANLTRNTAAALGIAFVTFVAIEPVLIGLLPRFARWSPLQNFAAYVTPGGFDVPASGSTGNDVEGYMQAMIHLSNLRSGIVLTLMIAAILGVATLLFSRRDVS